MFASPVLKHPSLDLGSFLVPSSTPGPLTPRSSPHPPIPRPPAPQSSELPLAKGTSVLPPVATVTESSADVLCTATCCLRSGAPPRLPPQGPSPGSHHGLSALFFRPGPGPRPKPQIRPGHMIDPTAKWAARQDWRWGNRPSRPHPKDLRSGFCSLVFL